MADVTVAQFANVLKVSVDKLLLQLDEAGIKVDGSGDTISEDAKLELLTHLRRSHGQEENSSISGAPRKITLKRKSQSELRLAGVQGRSRTVNVEVRRKRTYIKRDVLEEQAQKEQEALDLVREEEENRVANDKLEQERALAEKEESVKRAEEEKQREVEAKEQAEIAAREEKERAEAVAAEEETRKARTEAEAREIRNNEIGGHSSRRSIPQRERRNPVRVNVFGRLDELRERGDCVARILKLRAVCFEQYRPV